MAVCGKHEGLDCQAEMSMSANVVPVMKTYLFAPLFPYCIPILADIVTHTHNVCKVIFKALS